MSSNRNTLKKLSYPWQSKGVDFSTLKVPVYGILGISNGKTPPNPNPRIVHCLGCNRRIMPYHDCHGAEYKGQTRYICESCFRKEGFEW